ncbi:MAG: hypothetical protein ABJE10_12155 [bacterium]
MTWLAQVLHVARKDLRQARWLFVVYVAVVALVTMHMLGWQRDKLPVLDFGLIFVMGMGMVLAASLVQSDSPTRSDAFWASRPFYPLSVLTAKVALTVVLVLGVGLLGQFAALRYLDVTGGVLAAVMRISALEYAGWLFIVMPIAALSRDLRTVVVVLIVFLVSVLVVIGALSIDVALGEPQRELLIVTCIFGAIGLLAYLYRTRDARSRIWVAGFVIFGGSLFSLWSPGSSPRPPADSSLRRLTLDAEVAYPDSLGRSGAMRIRFHVRGRAPDERVTFTPSEKGVALTYRGRPSEKLSFERGTVDVTAPLLPTPPGTKWLDASADLGSTFELDLPLSVQQRDAVRAGLSSMTIDGSLAVDSAHIAVTLPLEPNATSGSDARHFVVGKTVYDAHDVLIELNSSFVRPSQQGESRIVGASTATSYALVNKAAGEAVTIRSHNSSSGGGMLVLSGAQLSSNHATLRAGRAPAGISGPQLSDSWFRASELTIVDWVRRGEVRVHASVAISKH